MRSPAVAEAERLLGDGHPVVVRLSGEFDIDIHVLPEVLAVTADRTVIIGLSRVAFADSAFLHALLDARRHVVLAGPLAAPAAPLVL